MKEKRSLLQRLAGAVKTSATRVTPRAKKRFKAGLKARGLSRAGVKAAMKKAGAAAPAKSAAKAAPAGKKAVGTARLQKLARAGSQLRVTPRKGRF